LCLLKQPLGLSSSVCDPFHVYPTGADWGWPWIDGDDYGVQVQLLRPLQAQGQRVGSAGRAVVPNDNRPLVRVH
jgi:hypothetical protein